MSLSGMSSAGWWSKRCLPEISQEENYSEMVKNKPSFGRENLPDRPNLSKKGKRVL